MSQKHQTRKFFELYQVFVVKCFNTFLNLHSFNARLNNHYKAWGYKKKKQKKIKAYRKFV